LGNNCTEPGYQLSNKSLIPKVPKEKSGERTMTETKTQEIRRLYEDAIYWRLIQKGFTTERAHSVAELMAGKLEL